DAEVEHLDRVRRVDLERRARLAVEPLGRDGIAGQVRLEQLDRDLAVHRELRRAEHRAHAALAEHGVAALASIEGDPDKSLRETVAHAEVRIAYRSSRGTRTSPR